MALLAICDAHYNFIAISIGEYGSNNDCGVLLNSRMGRKFQQNCINIPPPETLDGFDETVPFFLVAMAVHNYLQQADNAHYTPAGFVDSEDKSGAIIEGQWRKLIDSNFQNVGPIRNSRYAKNALQIREVLADFFVSKNGSVSWQWDHIKRTRN